VAQGLRSDVEASLWIFRRQRQFPTADRRQSRHLGQPDDVLVVGIDGGRPPHDADGDDLPVDLYLLPGGGATRPFVAAGDGGNRADVHELLEAHGYAIDKIGLEDINILCNGILRAQSETHRILAAMLEKRTEDTEPRDPLFKGVREPGLPPVEEGLLSPATEPAPVVSNDLPAKEAPLPTGEPLSEIFEAWKAEKKPDIKLAGEFGKSVRRFTELHGDVPAIAINKPMIREYKAALLKLPRAMSTKIRALKLPDLLLALEKAPPAKTISGGTVDKDLGALSAILAWAGKQGYFDANPFWSNPVAGMKLGADWDEEDDREPYSVDDLKLIFNSSVYSQGKRPKGGGGEAAKWLPLPTERSPLWPYVQTAFHINQMNGNF